jgi:hypothetical protein
MIIGDSKNRAGCCSIPRYGIKNFATLKKWADLMNPACCMHDDLYRQGWTRCNGVVITVKNRRQADEWFYNQMLKIAEEKEERYGVLGFHAAHDMYQAVRKFGKWAWIRSTLTRVLS